MNWWAIGAYAAATITFICGGIGAEIDANEFRFAMLGVGWLIVAGIQEIRK